MTNVVEHAASPLWASSEVEQFIQRGLEDGSLRPGSRLPTEREFAQMLGLSRASIRRALARQEASGAVVRHQGRGTFLAPDDRRRPAVLRGHDLEQTWTDTSPSEVMVVRSIFEPQIAMLAAQCATERDLDRIEHCLRETLAAPGYEEFEVWDGAFHRSIAEAAHNSFLLGIFDHINKVRGELRWGRLKRRSLTPERREAYEAEHGAVVNAIRERDGEQARALMARHLHHVRENMLTPDLAELSAG
jgi:DNA-binding FadR family transcriptional regulator